MKTAIATSSRYSGDLSRGLLMFGPRTLSPREEPDGPTGSTDRVGEVRRARRVVDRFEIIDRSIVAEIQKLSGHDRPPDGATCRRRRTVSSPLQARSAPSCRPVRAPKFENIPARCEFNHGPNRSHRIVHRYPGR